MILTNPKLESDLEYHNFKGQKIAVEKSKTVKNQSVRYLFFREKLIMIFSVKFFRINFKVSATGQTWDTYFKHSEITWLQKGQRKDSKNILRFQFSPGILSKCWRQLYMFTWTDGCEVPVHFNHGSVHKNIYLFLYFI